MGREGRGREGGRRQQRCKESCRIKRLANLARRLLPTQLCLLRYCCLCLYSYLSYLLPPPPYSSYLLLLPPPPSCHLHSLRFYFLFICACISIRVYALSAGALCHVIWLEQQPKRALKERGRQRERGKAKEGKEVRQRGREAAQNFADINVNL